MTLAIMQPYIFPYLGYYQLVAAVDKFVFFDDVNFINKGWINRNRVLQKNEPITFTVPLSKASQNKLINEIELSNYKNWKNDFLKLITQNYRSAPHFHFVINWLDDFLRLKDFNSLNELASQSVIQIAELFGIKTEFLYSSTIPYKGDDIKGGQQKILRICELLGADAYINPRNGMDLYDDLEFQGRKIELKFIVMDAIKYHQFDSNKFSESLSILDVMMFNDLESIQISLDKYKLVGKRNENEN